MRERTLVYTWKVKCGNEWVRCDWNAPTKKELLAMDDKPLGEARVIRVLIGKPLTRSHRNYATWSSMNKRCRNKNFRDYKYYGGKGITVCPEWRDFWKFVEDMGDKPEGRSIDRIDGSKGYSKENCRWETPAEQVANRDVVKNKAARNAK